MHLSAIASAIGVSADQRTVASALEMMSHDPLGHRAQYAALRRALGLETLTGGATVLATARQLLGGSLAPVRSSTPTTRTPVQPRSRRVRFALPDGGVAEGDVQESPEASQARALLVDLAKALGIDVASGADPSLSDVAAALDSTISALSSAIRQVVGGAPEDISATAVARKLGRTCRDGGAEVIVRSCRPANGRAIRATAPKRAANAVDVSGLPGRNLYERVANHILGSAPHVSWTHRELSSRAVQLMREGRVFDSSAA